MSLLGYIPEETVDFYIRIGLVPQSERQNKIDKIYKAVSEILAEMQSVDNDDV